jgi:hypothetical protein
MLIFVAKRTARTKMAKKRPRRQILPIGSSGKGGVRRILVQAASGKASLKSLRMFLINSLTSFRFLGKRGLALAASTTYLVSFQSSASLMALLLSLEVGCGKNSL